MRTHSASLVACLLVSLAAASGCGGPECYVDSEPKPLSDFVPGWEAPEDAVRCWKAGEETVMYVKADDYEAAFAQLGPPLRPATPDDTARITTTEAQSETRHFVGGDRMVSVRAGNDFGGTLKTYDGWVGLTVMPSSRFLYPAGMMDRARKGAANAAAANAAVGSATGGDCGSLGGGPFVEVTPERLAAYASLPATAGDVFDNRTSWDALSTAKGFAVDAVLSRTEPRAPIDGGPFTMGSVIGAVAIVVDGQARCVVPYRASNDAAVEVSLTEGGPNYVEAQGQLESNLRIRAFEAKQAALAAVGIPKTSQILGP